jgi:hypothetical protein
MADEGQKQIRRFPVSPSSVPVGGGMTADELKIHQGAAQRATSLAAQPLPERAPSELVSGSGSGNRPIAPPTTASFATAMGPRHNHILIRGVFERSNTAEARAFTVALKDATGVTPEQLSRMRANHSREHAMLTLLKPFFELQEEIYSRIEGRQAG